MLFVVVLVGESTRRPIIFVVGIIIGADLDAEIFFVGNDGEKMETVT